jgi:hypothetical protein
MKEITGISYDYCDYSYVQLHKILVGWQFKLLDHLLSKQQLAQIYLGLTMLYADQNKITLYTILEYSGYFVSGSDYFLYCLEKQFKIKPKNKIEIKDEDELAIIEVIFNNLLQVYGKDKMEESQLPYLRNDFLKQFNAEIKQVRLEKILQLAISLKFI